MKKALVLKYFTDKLTRVKHFAGETIELTLDRFGELESKGIVEDVKEVKPSKSKKEDK